MKNEMSYIYLMWECPIPVTIWKILTITYKRIFHCINDIIFFPLLSIVVCVRSHLQILKQNITAVCAVEVFVKNVPLILRLCQLGEILQCVYVRNVIQKVIYPVSIFFILNYSLLNPVFMYKLLWFKLNLSIKSFLTL